MRNIKEGLRIIFGSDPRFADTLKDLRNQQSRASVSQENAVNTKRDKELVKENEKKETVKNLQEMLEPGIRNLLEVVNSEYLGGTGEIGCYCGPSKMGTGLWYGSCGLYWDRKSTNDWGDEEYYELGIRYQSNKQIVLLGGKGRGLQEHKILFSIPVGNGESWQKPLQSAILRALYNKDNLYSHQMGDVHYT